MSRDEANDRIRGERGEAFGRRQFLRAGIAGGLGLGLGLGSIDPRLAGAFLPPDEAPAQSLIHIFLQGGLSHIDSFDPKPYAPVEVRGGFGTVKSSLDGERLSGRMRLTAKIANKITIIRSMTHGEAAHERGTHNMLTGYRPSPAIVYPSMGSVIAHQLGPRKNLPPYVCIPAARDPFAGTGYLSSACGPFSLSGEPNNGNFKVRDLSPPGDVDTTRLDRRRRMLDSLDGSFAKSVGGDAIDATDTFYEQAYQLIGSKEARSAFDINAEPGKLRNRYGRTAVGQKLLMARRLVQSGVRYVTVFDGGYDNHRDIERGLRTKLRDLDGGFSALITDLAQKGMLERTLVLVTSEFGRTPRINPDRGRDHWPKVFSVILAGGGIKAGCVHGASNADGSEPERDPVMPPDLAATVFTQLGIDPTRKLMSPGDRPIDIVRHGQVIKDILA